MTLGGGVGVIVMLSSLSLVLLSSLSLLFCVAVVTAGVVVGCKRLSSSYFMCKVNFD